MKRVNSLQNHKRSDTIKWVIAFVLIAVLISAVIVLGVKLNAQITTATVGATAYEIGSLDDSGKPVDNTGFIVTKDYISANGLTVKIDKDANVQYKVYYFAKSETDASASTFLSASETWLKSDLDGTTIPEGADLVKIVIQPVGDAEVSLFEVIGYAKQLTVTYNK